MDLLYVAAGLVILLVAGDALVKGAVSFSLRLGVPAFIVSLTIVAFGTSAPELLIAVKAALEGAPGLALGNVIGSNIANVLLVLGVPAAFWGLNTKTCETARNYVYSLVATVIFIGLCFLGPLHVWHGVVLLALLALMLGEALFSAAKQRRMRDRDPLFDRAQIDPDTFTPKWQVAALLLVGLAGLPLGADLLVSGAVSIAGKLGVDEAIIGLTLVALGTSLPELATTVMAAYRKQADVALGNVIGSNMFNLLGIIGVASFFGPLGVASKFLLSDLWIMLAATLVLAPFALLKLNLGKSWGVLFVTCYIAYIVFLLV